MEEGAAAAERAAALRAEVEQLEKERDQQQAERASETPVHELTSAEQRWSQLAGSCWKLSMDLQGVKEERSTLRPVQVTTTIRLQEREADGLAPVTVLEPTKYIQKGFVWSTGLGVDDNSDDESTYLRFNLRAEEMEPTVPSGSVYVNARVAVDETSGTLSLEDGLVTVKQPKKVSFLWTVYEGLLAEFKVIGSCTLSPIPPPS